jgi:sugar lactone lactonase YvrE
MKNYFQLNRRSLRQLKVNTIAGGGSNGDSGYKNGVSLSAKFYYPYSTAIDSKGNMYVADQGNSIIRKLTPAGVVSTLAGSGIAGYADGVGTAASFSNPKGIAVDSVGNVYVADAVNNRIRKITSNGVVTTIAGNGISGFIDGNGTQASFYNPSAITLDAAGNLYVADEKNHAIRKITPAGDVNTIAGTGASGSANGNGSAASFNYPSGIALGAAGNIYVADFSNHKIRKITSDGLVTTIAGSGSIGRANGLGRSASFHNPTGISIDNVGNIYVADGGNHQIRKINTQGQVSSLPCTESEGSVSNLTTNTGFYNPSSVVADGKGHIYITDQNNNRVRKVSVTGYTISPSLPSGLVFNSSTGIITGNPEIATELTEYVITAYNSGGTSITNLKLATSNSSAAADIATTPQ